MIPSRALALLIICSNISLVGMAIGMEKSLTSSMSEHQNHQTDKRVLDKLINEKIEERAVLQEIHDDPLQHSVSKRDVAQLIGASFVGGAALKALTVGVSPVVCGATGIIAAGGCGAFFGLGYLTCHCLDQRKKWAIRKRLQVIQNDIAKLKAMQVKKIESKIASRKSRPRKI